VSGLRDGVVRALALTRWDCGDHSLCGNTDACTPLDTLADALLPLVAAERDEAARQREAEVVARVEGVLSDRVTASLPTADWACETPFRSQYAYVNPEWLRTIVTEARAVRAALTETRDE
jgi:hypothetical protein